jgi:hypothetical protein
MLCPTNPRSHALRAERGNEAGYPLLHFHRRTWVVVSRCMKRPGLPSSFGHNTRSHWLGIRHQARIRSGTSWAVSAIQSQDP